MSNLKILPTVYNFSSLRHGGGNRGRSTQPVSEPPNDSVQVADLLEGQHRNEHTQNEEFKLPKLTSLSIVILANALCQV